MFTFAKQPKICFYMKTLCNLSKNSKVGLSHLLFSLGVILMLIGLLSSCGTSRMSVRVKSNSDGTMTSNVSISGSVDGGSTTPNVEVVLPDTVKLAPKQN